MKYYNIKENIKRVFYKAIQKLTQKKMIIDVTGTLLTPGNSGKNCKGNGTHLNLFGKLIPCCCDECSYLMCCLENFDYKECENCNVQGCPHLKSQKFTRRK